MDVQNLTSKNIQIVSHNSVFRNINVLEMCRIDGNRQPLGAVRKLQEKPRYRVKERVAALTITSFIG